MATRGRKAKEREHDLAALYAELEDVRKIATITGLSEPTIRRDLGKLGIDLSKNKGAHLRKVAEAEFLLMLIDDDETVLADDVLLMVRRSRLKKIEKQLIERTGSDDRAIQNRLKKLESDGLLSVLDDAEFPAYRAWIACKRDANQFRSLTHKNVLYRLDLLDAQTENYLCNIWETLKGRFKGDLEKFMKGVLEVLSYRKAMAILQADHVLKQMKLSAPWHLSEGEDVANWYKATLSLMWKASHDFMMQLPEWFLMIVSESHTVLAGKPSKQESMTESEFHQRQAKAWEKLTSPQGRNEFEYLDLGAEMEALLTDLRQRFAFLHQPAPTSAPTAAPTGSRFDVTS